MYSYYNMYEINEEKVINLDYFPKVIVNLHSVKDTMSLINHWLKLYELNTPFTFIFNLNNLNANLKDLSHGILLANFIKKIKKNRQINPNKYNLLKESIIVVKDKLSNTFIRSVFNLTSPLSNTYIVNSIQKAEEIYECILKDKDIDFNNVKLIKP